MLVLTQDLNDPSTAVDIILPDGRRVTVELMEVRGMKKVRLGYTAPRDVKIIRRGLPVFPAKVR